MMNYKRLICLLAIAYTHTWNANGSSFSSVAAKHGKTSSQINFKGETKTHSMVTALKSRRVECDPDHPEECPKHHEQENASSEEHQDSSAANSGSSKTTSGGTGTSTSTSSASSGTTSSSSSKYSKNSGSGNNGGTGNATIKTKDSKFAWSSVLLIIAAAVAAVVAAAKKVSFQNYIQLL